MLTSSFKLNNFEGPLELLLHLVQQGEMSALELILEHITEELTKRSPENNLDENAEVLFLTASLIHLKSQELLPIPSTPEESADNIKGEIIEKIIELYAIKERALQLEESLDSSSWPRGRFYEERSKELALPTAAEFGALFQRVWQKSQEPAVHTIGPTWQVKERLSWLKKTVLERGELSFLEVFAFELPLLQRIVTFLAALELLRCQEIFIEKQDEKYYFRSHRPALCSQRASP